MVVSLNSRLESNKEEKKRDLLSDSRTESVRISAGPADVPAKVPNVRTAMPTVGPYG